MFACRSITLMRFEWILIHLCRILRKCWWCVIHSMVTLYGYKYGSASTVSFRLAMPLVSTLDWRIFICWAGNSCFVAGPCNRVSIILSYSSDKIVIFSTYDTRSSIVHVFLPCGDTMYCNVSVTSACNYYVFKLMNSHFINYLKLNMIEK